jgi:carbonic anhydrase/acetyltransferase-like protein (isoleucine patch superfamily)
MIRGVLSQVARRLGRNLPGQEAKSKYGKYAYLFEEKIPGTVLFADKWDKHKTIVRLDKKLNPKLSPETFVAPSATLAGNVEVWDKASIWYNVTIRGDVKLVRIGAWTNVQDNTVITEAFQPIGADHDGSTIIGHYVTIGHGCQLRACTVEDGCLVGMGSILSEGSYMEKNSMLGANSVLLSHDRVPTGEFWAGNPAKKIRNLTEHEIENIRGLAKSYFILSLKHGEEYYLNNIHLAAEDAGLPIGWKKYY